MNSTSHSTVGRLVKMSASIPSLSTSLDLSQVNQDFSTSTHSVHYQLRLLNIEHQEPNEQNYQSIDLNQYVGKEITIDFLGKISCTFCGRKTKKPYGDGLCYPCFMEKPDAAECILRPALCRAHLGEGRDPLWEKENHFQPHYVYMVLSSKYKVGVTKNWPTRWLDQGADAVKVIAKTPYRQLAGLIELELSKHYSDKLSWQGMLKDQLLADGNLSQQARRCYDLLPSTLQQYCTLDSHILHLTYPKITSPEKVKSQKLDKVESISGLLHGIKGQYLIFEGGRVINIRSHAGYHIRVTFN